MRVIPSTALCLLDSKVIRTGANLAPRLISTTSLNMTSAHDSIPHVVRTAHEPRQAGTWHATHPLRHLPGQYIDLHIPGIPIVGGFTITSPPQTALPITSTDLEPLSPSPSPYIELVIQKSLHNPPAAYLWHPPSTILNSSVSFQVGGRFTYPPVTLDQQECAAIENAVFVAGGVGMNPIMSMQAHRVQRRRIGHQDLLAALGPESEWAKTVVYVCGVPQMTDEFTNFLRKQKGLEDKRILCEKWW
ncbi:hypothetical protein DV736_g4988, partial [Chaetothyriales sp. CBS 134916]